jgi:hypothetical protein
LRSQPASPSPSTSSGASWTRDRKNAGQPGLRVWAGAWLGSRPSAPSRKRPPHSPHAPVCRPAGSRSMLVGAGALPVPGQLPSGTPMLRGYRGRPGQRPS